MAAVPDPDGSVSEPFSVEWAQSLELGRYFLPRTLFLYPSDGGALPQAAEVLLSDKAASGELTVYPCQVGRCETPLVGVEAVKQWLKSQACGCTSAAIRESGDL